MKKEEDGAPGPGPARTQEYDPMEECRLPGAATRSGLQKHHAIAIGLVETMNQNGADFHRSWELGQTSRRAETAFKVLEFQLWLMAARQTAQALREIREDTPDGETDATLALAQHIFIDGTSDNVTDKMKDLVASNWNNLQEAYAEAIRTNPGALERNPSLRPWSHWS